MLGTWYNMYDFWVGTHMHKCFGSSELADTTIQHTTIAMTITERGTNETAHEQVYMVINILSQLCRTANVFNLPPA